MEPLLVLIDWDFRYYLVMDFSVWTGFSLLFFLFSYRTVGSTLLWNQGCNFPLREQLFLHPRGGRCCGKEGTVLVRSLARVPLMGSAGSRE